MDYNNPPNDLVPEMVYDTDLSKMACVNRHWRNAIMVANNITTPAQRAIAFWEMVNDCITNEKIVPFIAISDYVCHLNRLDESAKGSIRAEKKEVMAMLIKSIAAEPVEDPIQHILKAIYTEANPGTTYLGQTLSDTDDTIWYYEIVIGQGKKNGTTCRCRLYINDHYGPIGPSLIINCGFTEGTVNGKNAAATVDHIGWKKFPKEATKEAIKAQRADLFYKIIGNGFTFTPDPGSECTSAIHFAAKIVFYFIADHTTYSYHADPPYRRGPARVHDVAC